MKIIFSFMILCFALSGCSDSKEVWRCYDKHIKKGKDHHLVTIDYSAEEVFIERFSYNEDVTIGNMQIGLRDLPPEFDILNINLPESTTTFSPNTVVYEGKMSKYEINLPNKTMLLTYSKKKCKQRFCTDWKGEYETGYKWFHGLIGFFKV